jgi:hypothetical protein
LRIGCTVAIHGIGANWQQSSPCAADRQSPAIIAFCASVSYQQKSSPFAPSLPIASSRRRMHRRCQSAIVVASMENNYNDLIAYVVYCQKQVG